MAIDFTVLQTEVIARLGNRTDIGGRSEKWINHAFLELLTNPRFAFYEQELSATFLTEAGENTYNLSFDIQTTDDNGLRGISEDLWVITSLYDESNRQLLKKSHMREMERRGSSLSYTTFGNDQNNGKPIYYCRVGNVIVLFPVPDDGYRIGMRYLERPPLQQAGTDFMGIGEEWEELLTQLSVIRGFLALGQTDRATELRQHMEQLIAIREEVVKLDDANTEYGIQPELDQA